MGFSVVVAVTLLSIAVIVVFTGVFLQVNNYVNKVGDAMQSQIDLRGDKSRTEIEIINVSQDSSTYIYVENTGAEVLDPSRINLFINGNLVPEGNYWMGGAGYFTETMATQTTYVYNISNASQIIGFFEEDVTTKSFVYTNNSAAFYWEPSDMIELISDYAILSTGDNVKVSVDYGVFDKHIF